MLVTGVSFMLMQRLREVHYSVMLTLFGLWGTLECLALSLLIGKMEVPRDGKDWLMAGGLALLSVTAQTCLTLALKFEKAGPVSLIRTCDVVFGFIWQFFILGVEFDIIS
jgi:drug/metabolite transporter (DMT)-like permease